MAAALVTVVETPVFLRDAERHLSEAERELLTAFFAASDASGLAPAGSALGD